MNNYTRRMLTVAGVSIMAIGMASVSGAQAPETIAKVPFAFTAGNTAMPPGTYHLATLADHTDVLTINGLQRSVVVLGQHARTSDTDSQPCLVFDRHADGYFLREIRLAGSVGFHLPSTAAENAAERVASGAKPEVVVVRLGQ